jgi:hypothetical protein
MLLRALCAVLPWVALVMPLRAEPAPVPLTAEQMAKAVRYDAITVPAPAELLTALGKAGKPTWQEYYRRPASSAYTSRAQIALNLGALIADGYLAVEAEDSQQVKNMGTDILGLAKSLGVSQNVLSRGNSIADFAENNEWGTLREELEATQNEVRLALEEQRDQDLVILVTLGGWIRGTEVVSTWVTANYTPEAARLLRQPAIVAFLRGKIGQLSGKLQEDELVRSMEKNLAQLEKLVAFPAARAPEQGEVSQVRDLAQRMVAEMTRKKEKE